jgi:hypothetical protein
MKGGESMAQKSGTPSIGEGAVAPTLDATLEAALQADRVRLTRLICSAHVSGRVDAERMHAAVTGWFHRPRERGGRRAETFGLTLGDFKGVGAGIHAACKAWVRSAADRQARVVVELWREYILEPQDLEEGGLGWEARLEERLAAAQSLGARHVKLALFGIGDERSRDDYGYTVILKLAHDDGEAIRVHLGTRRFDAADQSVYASAAAWVAAHDVRLSAGPGPGL